MGILSGLMKAGIAKKVYDEARKPQNQARARQLVAQMRQRRAGQRRPH